VIDVAVSAARCLRRIVHNVEHVGHRQEMVSDGIVGVERLPHRVSVIARRSHILIHQVDVFTHQGVNVVFRPEVGISNNVLGSAAEKSVCRKLDPFALGQHHFRLLVTGPLGTPRKSVNGRRLNAAVVSHFDPLGRIVAV
jgi:hypothetical protein